MKEKFVNSHSITRGKKIALKNGPTENKSHYSGETNILIDQKKKIEISKKKRENDLKDSQLKKREKFSIDETNLQNILHGSGGIKKSKQYLKNGSICDSRPVVQGKISLWNHGIATMELQILQSTSVQIQHQVIAQRATNQKKRLLKKKS